jgi:hypothetical protein
MRHRQISFAKGKKKEKKRNKLFHGITIRNKRKTGKVQGHQ